MLGILLLLAGLGASVPGAAWPDEPKFVFVDLHGKTNQSLAGGLGLDENSLAELKPDELKLKGTPFKIAKEFIHLGSPMMEEEERKNKPDKVEGIPVNSQFTKLHILHATEYGTGNFTLTGKRDGGPLYITDDTPIAEYKIHYADGATERIPVVYGKDVRDWWFNEKSPGVTRGQVVWTGENEKTKSMKWRLRLYATAWQNPHPEKKVLTIDFQKVGKTAAAPFCIAFTLEK